MDGQEFLRETALLVGVGWCCGADARDRRGDAVAAGDPAAVSWSLVGALVAVSERHDSDATALRDALWGISGVIPDLSLDGWNDAEGRSQTETVAMLADAGLSLEAHPPPSGGWSS